MNYERIPRIRIHHSSFIIHHLWLFMVTFLAIIAVGFFLGMRHATDPDHVIAVSTIVSRQRSIRQASLIGMLWGLGHTITIVLVGAAIILFSLVIPPRLGLAMELSVGLMLVALGALNLSGFTRWVTETFTPASGQQIPLHSHPHVHGDYIHTHPHGHNPEAHGHRERDTPQGWLDRTFGRLGLYQFLRPEGPVEPTLRRVPFAMTEIGR